MSTYGMRGGVPRPQKQPGSLWPGIGFAISFPFVAPLFGYSAIFEFWYSYPTRSAFWTTLFINTVWCIVWFLIICLACGFMPWPLPNPPALAWTIALAAYIGLGYVRWRMYESWEQED